MSQLVLADRVRPATDIVNNRTLKIAHLPVKCVQLRRQCDDGVNVAV